MAKKDSQFQEFTCFERARVVGARALQLSMGAPPLVDAGGISNAVKLALIEFEKNVVPLRVVRKRVQGN